MTTTEKRFWKYVDKRGKNECWNWTGATTGKYNRGYIWNGRECRPHHLYAYRLSYMIHCGDIPDGMYVIQKCHNYLCVNPNHLVAVTHKGKPNGRKGKHNKRTQDIVQKAIDKYKNTDNRTRDICSEFGITPCTLKKWAGKRGFTCGHKITSKMCDDIIAKSRDGLTQQAIADEYGIHYSTVSLIVRGKRRSKRKM